MNDKLTDEQSAAILDALNKAIDEGPWDQSNFLKAVGKNLITIRDNFIAELEANPDAAAAAKAKAGLAQTMALRDNQQEIYISLYCFDGSNLQSWERIVANLPKQTVSRPIYANEDDVKEAKKIKENKLNEAYVAIYINKGDILPVHPDKIQNDKLGKPLLCLKDKSLQLDNLSRFVHESGSYEYTKGRLVKIN
jgi:intracellular multiplication protein IcmQ